MINSNNLVKLKFITKSYSSSITGSQKYLQIKFIAIISRLFLNLKSSTEFNFHFINLFYLHNFVARPCCIISINNNRGIKS